MLVWQAHKTKLRQLAFSPDSRWLVTTAGSSKYPSVWEAATGAKHPTKASYNFSGVPQLAFAPSGELLLGNDSHVAICRMPDVVRVGHLDVSSFADATVAVCPATGRVVAGEMRRWLVWDGLGDLSTYRSRKPDRKVAIAPAIPLKFAYSSTGAHFAVADTALELWDPAPGRKPVRELRDPGGAKATLFAFNRDDTLVAVAFGQRVAVWALADADAPPVQLRGHTGMVRAAGFLPSGGLLTAGMDGVVRVWDANSGNELRSHDWGIGKVQAATVSADGTLCAAGSDDGRVVVWDTEG
jgi:WD40 repeat protein